MGINGERRFDAIDTSWVFWGYALLAGIGGLLLIAWGPLWFGSHLAEQPWGKAVLVRLLGALILALGNCAAGFATIEDTASRRRGLLFFAWAHAVVFAVALSQLAVFDGDHSFETWVVALMGITVALFWLWGTDAGWELPGIVTLFGTGRGARSNNTERLRTAYEQQILESARIEERHRLARDLHDSVKQQIFAIQTAAATAQARFDTDQPGARQALDQVRAAAREAIGEMQAMLDQLRAEPLENSGLVAAIKHQCEALGFRTGASVKCRIGDLPPAAAFSPGAQQAILRVAQEALANIARHARARNVELALETGAGVVELRIRDDGSGFDSTSGESSGQGLANMRARAGEFGGTFELLTAPGKGTSILLTIPYSTPESSRHYAWHAALCAALGGGLILLIGRGNRLQLVFPAVLAAIGLVRNAVAFRRARQFEEASR